VAEALRAGLASDLLVTPSAYRVAGLRELVMQAAEAGVEVVEAPRPLLDSVAPDHQGVAARVRMPSPRGERDVQAFRFGSDAVVVVLDGITDPQNVGAAARAAEAAGAEMLILRERRSARVTAAAVRASAGALLHLPHARVPNLTRVLESLKERGFSAVGLDERAEASIYDRPCPPGRVALVVGSEGAGISRLVRRTCDFLVRLPMTGSVGSLNAASALAAVLYGYVLDRGKARQA
jgi:23S rRNA (guanosine2251-2'-O)-methyltransferase